MAIEGIRATKGQSRAKIICDDCGKDDCVPCAYTGKQINNEPARPIEGQARSKALHMGWSYVKNKLRCPTCEAKRKVVPMKQKQPDPEPIREPTRAQKREIMDMLETVYDTQAERYKAGDTDDTVADVLGVMPGWVAGIREDFFGPDGGNENIEELIAKIDAFEADGKAILRAAEQVTDSAAKKLAEVSTMRAELDRIKKAVGPRVAKAAGVK